MTVISFLLKNLGIDWLKLVFCNHCGGAIAFFRALFGCFVLNFSSHFLLLTPPGKKTTTGDTTSSLKNYVQNKSYYQSFQICLLCLCWTKSPVQCCLWICVLVHLTKIKICTARKTREIATVPFCAPRLFMCKVNKPNYFAKLYQNWLEISNIF